MMRRFPLLVFAGFIDFFQFLIGLALMSLPFTGAAVGAAGAAASCNNYLPGWQGVQAACVYVGGTAGAVVGWFVGTAAAPIGLILAPVLVFCIGAIFGTMLVVLLLYSGAFNGKLVVGAYLGEVMPFFGFLPFWTGMTWKCLSEAAKKDKEIKLLEKQQEAEPDVQYLQFIPSPSIVPPSPPNMPSRNLPTPQADSDNGGARIAPREKIELKSPDIHRPQKAAVAVAILALFFAGGGVQTVLAQVAPEPVRFTIAPEIPGPNEPVIIEAEGIGTSLGDAEVVWQIDGKTVLSGTGERRLSFTTGALGSTQKVRVTIRPPTGVTITRDFTFTPSLVHLIWEADTTIPFFYRGAALYSAGSGIKVVAFPHIIIGGREVAAGALSYQWTLGGESVPQSSGVGRNSFSFEGDQLQTAEVVSVDALLSGIKVGHAEIAIPTSEPLLVLYYRDPLRGVLYESALPAVINLTGQEIAVRAEPYFFSKTSLADGNLVYSWTLDDSETSSPDSARGFLVLRQTGGNVGNAQLNVTLQNTDSSMLGQSASAALQILFGQQSSAGGASLGAAVINSLKSLAQNIEGPTPNFTAPNFQQVNAVVNSQQFQQTPSFGSAPSGPLNYKPLEPIPGFTGGACVSIADYLSAFLKIFISIGAVFAVLTLTIGGVMYMMSDIVNVKSKAKERMWAAMWGLLLVCIAWLILNTINPQLVNFSGLFTNPCFTGATISPVTPPVAALSEIEKRQTEELTKEKCFQYTLDNESYNRDNFLKALKGLRIVGSVVGNYVLGNNTFSTYQELDLYYTQQQNLARIGSERCTQAGL